MSAFQGDVVEGTADVVSRMIQPLVDGFVSHPQENGMTYREHFWHAMRQSYHMGYGSICLMIHAVCPFLCTNTGTHIIKRLYRERQQNELNQEEVKEV